uniref:Uncharacterized protein n=1 Tax=Rhizophora mucronata TaxID=61149 RepID=A0A2P2N5J1_RHIMU
MVRSATQWSSMGFCTLSSFFSYYVFKIKTA